MLVSKADELLPTGQIDIPSPRRWMAGTFPAVVVDGAWAIGADLGEDAEGGRRGDPLGVERPTLVAPVGHQVVHGDCDQLGLGAGTQGVLPRPVGGSC